MGPPLRRAAGRPLLAALPFVVSAVLVAACAAAPPPSGPIAPGTDARPRDIPVVLKDYYFVPNPIRLVPGETVRFRLINGGTLPHDFVLGGQAVQAAWASAEAAATPPLIGAPPPSISLPPELAGQRVYLASGAQADALYHVPAAPTPLAVACHISGHLERGMTAGVVYVTPAGLPLAVP